MSLLHKEIGVDAGGYMSMMRPWFCGVGDQGQENLTQRICLLTLSKKCAQNGRPIALVPQKVDSILFILERTLHLKTKCVIHKNMRC